jgi:glycosyltransferase involved in cell wall biosynthesis
MMHVLFLPKWYPNKYDPFDGNFIENHAHAIKLKVKISLIFVHSEADCPKKYRVELKNNQGINESRVFYKKPNSGLNLLDKVISFIRYRKAQTIGYQKLFSQNEKPDLVHIHVLSRPALLALKLNRKFSIPFVITEHWSGYLKSNGNYRGFLKKKFTEYIVKKASRINTVSSQLRDSMMSHGLKNNYEIIPNVVNTTLFKPLAKSNPITEIIFVGNLLQSPKKIFDIIKGMNFLKEAGKKFHLSIYGEGLDEEAAKKLCFDLNLDSNISFKGTRNRADIGEAMALSDFLILFSEFENQPCVISEGHSCGIPIIVPDLLGITERMKPELGVLVQTGNQVDFEKALLHMIDNHKLYDADYIRFYGVSQFGEKEIANQFYHFYQKAL